MPTAEHLALADPTEEWLTAFHEAGHVIMRMALAGRVPDEVCLGDDPAAAHVRDAVGWVSGAASRVFDTPGPLTLRRGFAISAAVNVAGELAELIARGHPIDPRTQAATFFDDDAETYEPGHDLHNMRLTVEAIAHLEHMAGEEPWGWLTEVVREADEVLRFRWETVTRVAAELVRRRRLTGHDLVIILDCDGADAK